MNDQTSAQQSPPSVIDRIIRFCLEKKLIVALMILFFTVWGILVAPFDWDMPGLNRDPVPVDAIPDIGENQQIVFTDWEGRSPQDVQDQITYPLTVSLLGIPHVKTIRSNSMFGFSTIFIIFDEQVDFYWSRSRVLERLSSLMEGVLPEGVQPILGPDATALGQVFWYTLEGLDEKGHPTGGWDLHELRSIQDWYVRYALQSVEGVSEVASVGGFVKEYQIDVDPDAMRAHDVMLDEVIAAVQKSNLDVGARSIEINRVAYMIRGVGFIRSLEDIENTVIKVNDNVPLYVRNVAHVSSGPAPRSGVLDKEGAETVGGVVTVRFGENPLAVIRRVKEKIEEITPGLPRRTLADGTVSQVQIVPFYDRTGLIYETLDTLNTALAQQILITIVVILIMLMHLRSSILISGLLPLSVLMCFIAMKIFKVDANIVSLSGIAIAIGTIVDMGIIICENIFRHLEQWRQEGGAKSGRSSLEVVYQASSEVGGAVLTAVCTTVISVLPVFTMEAAEGKLFRPLAFTYTFILIASIIVTLTIIPSLAHLLFVKRKPSHFGTMMRKAAALLVIVLGIVFLVRFNPWLGLGILLVGAYSLLESLIPENIRRRTPWVANGVAILLVTVLLSSDWLPLGPERGLSRNLLFVILLVGSLMAFFFIFLRFYNRILSWCLENRVAFLSIPLLLVLLGVVIWLGFERIFGWLPQSVRIWRPVSQVAHLFPGLGKEFMPPLDEGSYLFMPTVMPHASIGEALDIMQKQNMTIRQIPEVESAVGKLGRAESPLDPAPISMIETIIIYKSQFITDAAGKRLTFRYSPDEEDDFRDEKGQPLPAPDGLPYKVRGRFHRDEQGRLIIDETGGHPFRLWRPPLDPELNPEREAWSGVRSPDDIWDLVVREAQVPGSTSAPRLQPIAARIVMLQSGMRAPMGLKVYGPDLSTIEQVGYELEALLKEVPSIDPATVIADRIVGKPYLEIRINREAIARYGVFLGDVQEVIEVAIGGKQITMTVEGRERYPVRIRYLRELRDSIESLERILVPAPGGVQIPLIQLADIEYVRGPEMIKSEDTFLVGYVLFDKKPGFAEVDVVEMAQAYLRDQIERGRLTLPAGVSYTFAGSYENQVRAEKRLRVVLPLALFLIFLILYLQFNSIPTTSLVFSEILVAWSGGFILIWLYAQPWFLDFAVLGVNLRDLFQVHPINLSVAVWVGFLALFGIASDDGVVMATYLDQSFSRRRPTTVAEIRRATLEAASRRVRPCLMTTATTLLALLPVMTSTDRGSDIMVPMAIPSFGGMLIGMITMFVVPVLYCSLQEFKMKVSERVDGRE